MNEKNSSSSSPLHTDSSIPSDLGAQLANILYSNTKLNYDAAASNLVLVFQHLSAKLPDFKHISNSLVKSIQANYL